MFSSVHLAVAFSILEAAYSLRPLQISYRRQAAENYHKHILRRILENLASTKLYLTSNSARRYITPEEMARSSNIYEAIARNREERAGQVVSVSVPEVVENREFSGLVEKELQTTVQKQSSALLDKATVEKRGHNDFLVFNTGNEDPFVTVIPNNIYYNIEKKCANWLDDCSLKGIRDRLLQRENSPFK